MATVNTDTILKNLMAARGLTEADAKKHLEVLQAKADEVLKAKAEAKAKAKAKKPVKKLSDTEILNMLTGKSKSKGSGRKRTYDFKIPLSAIAGKITDTTVLIHPIGGVSDPCFWGLYSLTQTETGTEDIITVATCVGYKYRIGASIHFHYMEPVKHKALDDLQAIGTHTLNIYNLWVSKLKTEDKPVHTKGTNDGEYYYPDTDGKVKAVGGAGVLSKYILVCDSTLNELKTFGNVRGTKKICDLVDANYNAYLKSSKENTPQATDDESTATTASNTLTNPPKAQRTAKKAPVEIVYPDSESEGDDSD
jgi:hypothetical protein